MTQQTPQLKGLDVIADVVRAHYDLGKVQMPEQLPQAHQRRHRKMIVTTEAGRFLAKTYKRDPVVIDALLFQHRLSEHLHQHGLPVARIRRARDGKGFVEVDNWILELQQYVDAEAMKVSTPALRASANALGQFHKACQYLPAPPRDTSMWRFSEVPREPFQRLYQRAREENLEESVVAYCDDIARFLHVASEELAAEKRDLFETGLIHGDWHGGNLLFRGDKLLAIVDLEFAGAGCYLEDIAYAISNLCIRTTMSPEKMAFRTNMLLDYYQAHRSLSYSEQVALYYAVGVKHITTVSYQTVQEGKVAGYTAAEWLERLAIQCAWLSEQSRKARWGD